MILPWFFQTWYGDEIRKPLFTKKINQYKAFYRQFKTRKKYESTSKSKSTPNINMNLKYVQVLSHTCTNESPIYRYIHSTFLYEFWIWWNAILRNSVSPKSQLLCFEYTFSILFDIPLSSKRFRISWTCKQCSWWNLSKSSLIQQKTLLKKLYHTTTKMMYGFKMVPYIWYSVTVRRYLHQTLQTCIGRKYQYPVDWPTYAVTGCKPCDYATVMDIMKDNVTLIIAEFECFNDDKRLFPTIRWGRGLKICETCECDRQTLTIWLTELAYDSDQCCWNQRGASIVTKALICETLHSSLR